jgi:hypothetical protein
MTHNDILSVLQDQVDSDLKLHGYITNTTRQVITGYGFNLVGNDVVFFLPLHRSKNGNWYAAEV